MPERTVYKYIRFVPIVLVGYKWACVNNRSGSVLGLIGKEWGRPAFIPKPDTVFSADCLLDIVDFLEQIKPSPSVPLPRGEGDRGRDD